MNSLKRIVRFFVVVICALIVIGTAAELSVIFILAFKIGAEFTAEPHQVYGSIPRRIVRDLVVILGCFVCVWIALRGRIGRANRKSNDTGM
jgi:hypothetical protein